MSEDRKAFEAAKELSWEKNKYEGEDSFECDPFNMFNDGWQAAIAHKEAEHKAEIAELRALVSMKDDALKLAFNNITQKVSDGRNVEEVITNALYPNKGEVSEWEASKLEPLQKQVAMLSKYVGHKTLTNGDLCAMILHSENDCTCGADAALSNTQATAEAFFAERDAKVLEDYQYSTTLEIQRRIKELRATKVKEG